MPTTIINPFADKFFADAANFDGTSDYLTRGSDLTGSADGKQGALSLWLNLDVLETRNILLNANNRLLIQFYTTPSNIRVVAANAAGTTILSIHGTTTTMTTNTWYHVLACWDLSDTAKRHMYVNDVAQTLAITTWTDDTIDYTQSNWGVFGGIDGTFLLDGGVAEFWFDDAYIDFSTAANRAKFAGSDGYPVNLGADGSTPTGSSPLIYLHLDRGETANNIATSTGSGGGFTLTGSLTTESNSPPRY